MNETQKFILSATVLGAMSLWLLLPRSDRSGNRILAIVLALMSIGIVKLAVLPKLALSMPSLQKLPFSTLNEGFEFETQFWRWAAGFLALMSLFLFLPRSGMARGRAVGVVLGVVSLGLFFSRVPAVGNVSHSVFWLLAGTTVISAAASVTLRSPVYCAIWFAMTLLGTAGLLLLQGAQFLGIATVVVYAGAILVTFLFVLMLAQPQGHAYFDRLSWEGFLSASAGALLVGILTMTLSTYFYPPVRSDAPTLRPQEAKFTDKALEKKILADQHMAHLGGQLFSHHLITVEVAGTLLMVALVGAIAIVAQAKTIAQHEGGRAHG